MLYGRRVLGVLGALIAALAAAAPAAWGAQDPFFTSAGVGQLTSLSGEGAAVALLPDGQVLIAGGFGSGGANVTGSAEEYNPASRAFTPLSSSMNTPRYGCVRSRFDGRCDALMR